MTGVFYVNAAILFMLCIEWYLHSRDETGVIAKLRSQPFVEKMLTLLIVASLLIEGMNIYYA